MITLPRDCEVKHLASSPSPNLTAVGASLCHIEILKCFDKIEVSLIVITLNLAKNIINGINEGI